MPYQLSDRTRALLACAIATGPLFVLVVPLQWVVDGYALALAALLLVLGSLADRVGAKRLSRRAHRLRDRIADLRNRRYVAESHRGAGTAGGHPRGFDLGRHPSNLLGPAVAMSENGQRLRRI